MAKRKSRGGQKAVAVQPIGASPSLESELDALFARMQTATSRKGMARAFNASSIQLGRAAVNAARKRR
jgi:hypothetical protein